jgi:hypothetical protein
MQKGRPGRESVFCLVDVEIDSAKTELWLLKKWYQSINQSINTSINQSINQLNYRAPEKSHATEELFGYTNEEFDVRKIVPHHTIQINQPTRCSSFTSLLLDVYVWLNMFRAPFRPSSGAYNCIRSLWFLPLERRWSWSGRPRPTRLQPPLSNGKTRGS